MKNSLIAALSATGISCLAAATAAYAQETAPGAPRGTAPATIEGYGPSSAIVCDQAGTTCWHSVERYDYPPMRASWFIPTTGSGTKARITPGESTQAVDIGRETSGRRSKPISERR
jgi:hypothetical protein